MAFTLEKAEEEGKVKVMVTVSDKDFGMGLADALEFTVGERYSTSEARLPPQVNLAHEPPLRTTADTLTLSVTVEDDQAVTELYVYLGDKKIRYEANPKKGKHFTAEVPVRLEVGENILTVSAADNQKLVGSRTFFIYRSESGEELARSGQPQEPVKTR